MGDKSEVFCRQTLKLLQQNPQVAPPSLSMDDGQADLAAFDQIGTFLMRLTRLSERAQDTSIALGSDLMSFALAGYGLLRVSGKNQGLEDLRRELGARFARSASGSAVEAGGINAGHIRLPRRRNDGRPDARMMSPFSTRVSGRGREGPVGPLAWLRSESVNWPPLSPDSEGAQGDWSTATL